MLEDKLPNISITRIQVNTKFKPQIEDGEDFRTEVIKSFHNAIHYLIEKYITENDEFEQNILEIMNDRQESIKGTNEFSDLGEISIQVIEEMPVQIKQKDLDEDEIKELNKRKMMKIPKEQTKLTG